MRDPYVPWKQAVTLEEWLLKEAAAGRGRTPEFQAMLKFFGRDRFIEIWKNKKNELLSDSTEEDEWWEK